MIIEQQCSMYHRHRGKERVMTLGDDEEASMGNSALVILITLMIAAAVISSLLIKVAEMIFVETSSDADRGISEAGAFVQIIRLEILAYDSTNPSPTTDSLMLIFKIPFSQKDIAESEIEWVIGCPAIGAQASDRGYEYDRGKFTAATNLQGDGRTIPGVTEFETGAFYYLRIDLANCDIEPDEKHFLVITVFNGMLVEKNINYDSVPSLNEDLM